mmetsp:Transcript_54843/g.123469  ORF Transcript_54843/g.123469 Transcript_54843/m.123469 type:complete len:253 (+) Transcript_54843:477-1235(+)
MTGHELEYQDAERPPVDSVCVTRGRYELRGKVVRRAAGGVGLADYKLGQAHVSELHPAIGGDEEVLGLQVPVDDPPCVHVVEGKDHSSDVELCMLLAAVEALLVVRGIELAPQSGFQEEVQRLGSIVCFVKLDNEGRVCHQKDVLLIHDALLHSGFHDVALAQPLHGIGLARYLVLVELDGAKTAAAEEADLGQLLPFDPFPGLVLLVRLRLHGSCALDQARPASLAFRILRPLDDLLQGSEEEVEGVAVEG